MQPIDPAFLRATAVRLQPYENIHEETQIYDYFVGSIRRDLAPEFVEWVVRDLLVNWIGSVDLTIACPRRLSQLVTSARTVGR
jgi:hypothetical protein